MLGPKKRAPPTSSFLKNASYRLLRPKKKNRPVAAQCVYTLEI
jgi:hypothetical protein